MKKLNVIFSLLVIATLSMMVSCGGGGKSPADVVKKMNNDMVKGDYDAVIDVLATEGEEIDEEGRTKLKSMLAMGKGELDKKEGIKEMEVVSEEVAEDGNTAKVTLKIVYGNGEEEEEDYTLLKEDGAWKVRMQ